MPTRRSTSRYEQLTVEVDGTNYRGDITINDVGQGKEMFDLSFRGLRHHDTSVFRAGEPQIMLWAEIELKKLVRQWLSQQPGTSAG